MKSNFQPDKHVKPVFRCPQRCKKCFQISPHTPMQNRGTADANPAYSYLLKIHQSLNSANLFGCFQNDQATLRPSMFVSN